MICIINYGGGNLKIVENILKTLSHNYIISNKQNDILSAEKIIFPGQGHFGQSMEAIREFELDKTIIKALDKQIPFLGICVGLQVLFENSEEAPDTKGLGILKGSIVKYQKGKIPQIGWNKIKTTNNNSILFDDYYYFVNSYYAIPKDKDIISSTADYNIEFCSSIEKENLYATQFHPEKSGNTGVETIKRWLNA